MSVETSVGEVKENRGYLGAALWQSYEGLRGIKENPYVQSGIEKSISTVSYITPNFAQESIKQIYCKFN